MVASWGNIAQDAHPKFYNHMHHQQILAIGNCRSYGDVCISADHNYIQYTQHHKILEFDQETGIIHVEAGITLREILKVILPLNFVLKVTPGTSFATIGGCIANDIHGKNHETVGSFAQSILDFQLKLPSSEIITCSREKNTSLFWATIGGLGLTGVILSARLYVHKVYNTALEVTRTRHHHITSLLEAMKSFNDAPYSVAWIDTAQSGKYLGRGVLEVADYAAVNISPIYAPSTKKMPFFAPSWALNKFIVKQFNHLYFKRKKSAHISFETYMQFQYPLDHILHWNKLYGKQGFYQFQCVIPFQGAEEILIKMLTQVSQSGFISPLAVLKRMGEGSGGLLSFPMAGYTLALDIPARKGARTLLEQLEYMTLSVNGRIYPAKDYAMSQNAFDQMYPKKTEFLNILRQIKAKPCSKAALRYGLSI